jgi:hypothetical protein
MTLKKFQISKAADQHMIYLMWYITSDIAIEYILLLESSLSVAVTHCAAQLYAQLEMYMLVQDCICT